MIDKLIRVIFPFINLDVFMLTKDDTMIQCERYGDTRYKIQSFILTQFERTENISHRLLRPSESQNQQMFFFLTAK